VGIKIRGYAYQSADLYSFALGLVRPIRTFAGFSLLRAAVAIPRKAGNARRIEVHFE
jgi:hypothetical protein